MTSLKTLRNLLFSAFLASVFYNANAQNLDDKTYQHKMQLMDSLSFYKMQDYDTLYRLSISGTEGGGHWEQDYYGWIRNAQSQQTGFLTIDGKEINFDKKDLAIVKPLGLKQETIDNLKALYADVSARMRGNFAGNCAVLLWLYKKGEIDYSKELFPTNQRFLADSNIKKGFGYLYYDAMLQAYSYQRDYAKAIAFGEHLSGSIFKGFQYQKTAIALTAQLKNSPEDFKTFRLPDSLAWVALKQKLTRAEQIKYLADRLRLLNCIQREQPGGISYSMYQFAFSEAESGPTGYNYWEKGVKNTVINPYNELAGMKLNPKEVELLLPCLLTDTFIPSYNYHRDFFPERNLHHLSWVIESLIYETTNNLFLNRLTFDYLTPDEKKAEIDKIKKWCDENAGLSPEARTIKTLKSATKWADFYAAVQTAQQAKYDSLMPVIVQRFHDFPGGFWPSNKGVMAETMFEHGNENYINAVKTWSRDTSDIWVNLWSSLFLLKYDKSSYRPAMAELETVLKQCDGTSYYPHAMDLLLTMNDPRAFKLAEGILDKEGFQRSMDWGYYFNFVKRLLKQKSDYTFNFLNSNLEAITHEEIERTHKDNDHMMTEYDKYVLAVDELKNGQERYLEQQTNAGREGYIDGLKKWFKGQYKLLKDGKPNELLLDVKPEDAPVTFVDTYRQ